MATVLNATNLLWSLRPFVKTTGFSTALKSTLKIIINTCSISQTSNNVIVLFHIHRYFVKTQQLSTWLVSIYPQNTNKPKLTRRGQVFSVIALFHGHRYFLKSTQLGRCSVSCNTQNNNTIRLIRRVKTTSLVCFIAIPVF